MRFDIKVVSGRAPPAIITVEALSEEDAATQARGSGFTVLGVARHGTPAVRLVARNPKFPVLLFSQELIALLKAGLTLVEAILVIKEKESNLHVARMLERILSALQDGLQFSAALEAQDGAFPGLYIGAIRASERTGSLIESIERYITYQQQVDGIKKKILSASLYPLLLTAVGVLVLIFLLIYVVPRFSQIYQDRSQSLPWLSQALINWGAWVEGHQNLAFSAMMVVLFGSAMLLIYRDSRLRLVSILMRLPGIGAKLKIYHLARFYRTLAMLLRGGLPMGAALEVVESVVTELDSRVIASVRDTINRGVTMSDALASAGLTTPVSFRLLKVGERTGEFGDMLTKIAEFHEEETTRLLDWVMRVFEPALMVMMGLIIGGVVILMYMPIFELAGTIG